MILKPKTELQHISSAPRIRGDDPQIYNKIGINYLCSPHPRG